jgi:hypothetical protein
MISGSGIRLKKKKKHNYWGFTGFKYYQKFY